MWETCQQCDEEESQGDEEDEETPTSKAKRPAAGSAPAITNKRQRAEC